MALTPEEIKKVNEEFDRLISRLDSIDQNSLKRTREGLLSGKVTLEEWNRELKRFKSTSDAVGNSLGYIASSFKDSVNELQKQNKYLSSSKTIINNISKSAQEALNVRRGETDINVKNLSQAKQQISSQREQLEIAVKNGNLTKSQRGEIFKTLNDLDAYEAGLEGVLNTNKKINKELGVGPQLLGGLDKALQKLGMPPLGVKEAVDETRRLGQAAATSGEKFNAVSKFTSLLGNNLKGLLSTANLLTAAIGLFVKALISTDKTSGELAKNLGISYDESLGMVSSMTEVANLSNDAFVTTEGLVKAQQALSTALGTNVQLNSQLLVDYTKLTEQAGYSVEAATQLGILSQATGQTAKGITSQFLGQVKALNLTNNLALSEKQLLESIAKTSKGTLATFAAKPKELANAVFEAKRLGLEISQVEKIADGLLEIESSLTAEFEAEVITGRQLNLERARYFALTNDIAGVAKELGKQGVTQASFAKSSRIEQEAVAAAMGMSRDELGQMLLQQQALTNTGAKNTAELKAQYEAVRGTSEEQAFLNKLGNEEYAQQLKSQSVQDRFNQTVAKLQDIFVALAEPALAIISPFADLVNTLMPAINVLLTPLINGLKEVSKYAKEIFAVFGSIYAVQKSLAITEAILIERQAAKVAGKTVELGLGQSILSVMGFQNAIAGYQLAKEEGMNTLRAIGVALEETKLGAIIAQGVGIIKNIGKLAIENAARLVGMSTALATNAAVTFGAGVAIAVGAAAAGYAAIKALTGDDIMSPGEGSSGYGKRTLMGPEGAIALNNKDTVIAGTNLFPDRGNDRNLQPSGATNVTVTLSKGDIMAIANAVREGASQAKINVNLDGNAISNTLQTPMAMNTRGYSV